MLGIYISKGVIPEVNLKECISHTPPPKSVNKATNFGLGTEETSPEV